MLRNLRPKKSFTALAAIALFLIAVPALAQTPDNYVDFGAQGGDLPESAGVRPPAAPVLGGLTFYTDQALFEEAAPGLPLEDFEDGNVGPGAVTACSDPYDSTTTDACWTAGDVIEGLTVGSSSGGATVILGAGLIGNTSIVTGPSAFADFTILGFTAPDTNAIGMDFVLFPETFDVDIFGAGDVLLGSTTADASVEGTFWGVTSDVPIARIEFASPSGGGELLDNIQFGNVSAGPMDENEIPSLGWLGMLLLSLGLSGAAVFKLRRQRQ